MAITTYSRLLLLIILVAVGAQSVYGEEPEVCHKVLHDDSCTIPSCGEECFKQYKGQGSCLQHSPPSGSYYCNCDYLC
ncbi:hypothetical protein HanPSC8_Chr10g0417351 [Helianthus annuus]|nr:hypothetical protein HanPSC8_Chr10g0417351 [Helianthus annuus]